MAVKAQNTKAWLDVLQQLMPRGVAWNNAIDSNQTTLLTAIATSLSSTDMLCDQMQAELLPSATQILLDEYEHYLGLPECNNINLTFSSRQRQVVAKDKRQSGLAAWQIEALALEMGFLIKVDEKFPHHCLRSCDAPIYSARYRHTLDITVLSVPAARFTCLDNILTPLINNDARALECVLNKYKMAGKYYDVMYKEDV